MDTEKQTAKLSGKSAEIGNVEEDVSFRNLEGNNLEISFNPDYMRDALRASVTDSVIMSFTKPLRPFIINPDKKDIEFVQFSPHNYHYGSCVVFILHFRLYAEKRRSFIFYRY